MVLNLVLLLNSGEMLLSKVSAEVTSWFSPKVIGETSVSFGHQNISRQQCDSVDTVKPSEENPRQAKEVAWQLVRQLVYSSFDDNNLVPFYLW